MSIVLTILVLLLAVSMSGVVLRLLPVALPLPLVQIAMGALLGLPPWRLHVAFDHELFFLLFIPPLLFADGWRIPKREFFMLRGPIVMLAIGLVLFTVIGVGYFVHWMIPLVPLSVAFALASVLSPTDAVALGSITGGQRLPSRLKYVLEGEALMNDASGLVALQFAVLATLTGTFSWTQATWRFLLTALGGLLIGYLSTRLYSAMRRRIARWSGDMDPASHVALLLLLPFAAYLLAEHLQVSGILAAVTAGMTMNNTDTFRGNSADARMQTRVIWSMLEFVFNGVIFLLLGQQLPSIISTARRAAQQAGDAALWHLPLYVLAITASLIVLRFAWVWVSLQVGQLIGRLSQRERQRAGVRLIGVTALSGVRGAITLAAVLSLPLVMHDGSAFPARDLLILLAAGVIIATLLTGSIGLPLMLKNLVIPDEGTTAREERLARELTAHIALQAAEQRADELSKNADATTIALVAKVNARVNADYLKQLEAVGVDGEIPLQARREASIERELRLAALRAEREELLRLHRQRQINDDTLRLLVRELDLAEAWLSSLASTPS